MWTWTRTDDSSFLILSINNSFAIIVMNLLKISDQQLGEKIENIVRNFIEICVFVYCLGHTFGSWIHQLNDWLIDKKPEEEDVKNVEVITTPIIHPTFVIASEMQSLTVKQLKTIIGTKKKIKKQHLIEMAIC